jgi:mannose-1-phosphate guanylyltransferase
MDIGTPDKYLGLHYDLLGGQGGQYTFTRGDEVIVGERNCIDLLARVIGPVLLGNDNTIGRDAMLTGPVVIGSGAEIGPGAVIEGSVLWDDIQVGEGAVIKGSIVASNCRIEANSVVSNGSVLGDSVTLAAGSRLAHNSRIWPGTVVSD